MAHKFTSLLATCLFVYIDIVKSQYSPCQIQSFYARQYGSGQGNLLRVHLSQSGVPTNLTFTGSCDGTTIKLTKFTEERMEINGTLAVSFRWAVDNRYVVAVKEAVLVLKLAPKKGSWKRTFYSEKSHWFTLRSACDQCYEGLNKLETSSTPPLYVKSESSGIPFLGARADTRAWLEIMNTACS